MIKKNILIPSAAAAFLILMAYVVLKVNVFTAFLRYEFQNQLSNFLGGKAEIQKVVLHPPNKIIIKEITFEGGRCGGIVISVNPWKINKKLAAVSRITLLEPKINLEKISTAKPSQNDSVPPALPPIFIKKGALSYNDFNLTDINLEVACGQQTLAVKTEPMVLAGNGLSGKVKLSGIVRYDNELKITGKFIETTYQHLNDINGSFHLTGSSKGITVEGRIDRPQTGIKYFGASLANPFSLISSTQILAENPLRVRFYGKTEDLREILGSSTTSYILSDVKTTFEGEVKILPLEITSVFYPGNIKLPGKESVKNIFVAMKYSSGEMILNSTATMRSGKIDFNGKHGKDASNFTLNVTGIDLPGPRTKGKFSVKSAVSLKNSGDISIRGDIVVKDFALNNDKATDLTGKMDITRSTGVIDISGNDILASIHMLPNSGISAKIKYVDTMIKADGKRENLKFQSSSFDLSLINKNLSGLLEISGRIKHISDNPEISASFTAPVIEICKATTPVSGILFFKNGFMKISELKMSGASGNMAVDFNKGNTYGNLKISKCRTGLLLAPLKLKSDPLEGAVFGEMRWEGNLKNPNIKGIVAIRNGRILGHIPYKMFVTSFEYKNSKFIINDFVFKQKKDITAAKITAAADKYGFSALLNLNDIHISNKKLSGDIKITGKNRENAIEFSAESDNLIFDNFKNDFFASGKYREDKFEFEKFHYGKLIDGKASYYMKEKTLNANIKFNMQDISFINKNVSGMVAGNAKVSGKTDDLIVFADYIYKNGNIYGLPCDGGGKISYQAGTVKVEDTHFNLDGAALNISGNSELTKKSFLGLNVSGTDLKTSSIYAVLRDTYPMHGVISRFDVNITGPFSQPSYSFNITANELRANGEKIDSAILIFTILNKHLTFQKGDIKWKNSLVKILPSSNIEIDKKNKFKILSEIRNLKLPGCVIFGNMCIEGLSEKNEIGAEITSSNLWINQLKIKNLRQKVIYGNRILKLTPAKKDAQAIEGNIEFSSDKQLLINEIKIAGTGKKIFVTKGKISGNDIQMSAEGSGLNLGNIMNILNVKIGASGNTNFNIKVAGTVSEPSINCLVNSDNGKIGEVGFDMASVFFQVQQNILRMKHFKVSKKNAYLINGEGVAPLIISKQAQHKFADFPMDISLQAVNGNISILESITKAVKKAKGKFSMSLSVKGTVNKPDISGKFSADVQELQPNDIFAKLTNVKCDIDFKENKIEIAQLNALADGEPIMVSGYLLFGQRYAPKDFSFRVFTPKESVPVIINSLQIRSSSVGKLLPIMSDYTSFKNPSKARIKTDITLKGNSDSYDLDGFAIISKARFTYPGDDSEDGGRDTDFLKNINWNLRLKTGKECWYENEFVSVEGKGELLLHGKGSSPLVTGKVEAIRGELEYLGRTFRIKEALFEAENSKLYLSGLGETETEVEKRREDLATKQMITEYVPETIILTIDRGPLEEVKPRFSSLTNPKIDEQTATQAAIGLADTRQKQPFSTNEMSQAVNMVLTTPFVKSVLKRTGLIDRFSIKKENVDTPQSEEQQTQAQQFYRGTKLQFGKSFAQGISAAYGVKFDDFENKLSLKHEIELSYQLKSGILLRTTQGLGKSQDGDRSNEFYLQKYWRFGP